ncbi:CHAD domain-containing protein [Aquicoccus sp. SCR17]|nr:CHAD domain-containing protein [Carideicomes alvinocaridis]
MAYKFDTSRKLEDNMRKVARDQIEAALHSLSHPGDHPASAIHDARKRLKKLRGLLRLVRPGLGDTYAEENAALRETAHLLAPLRDAGVLVKTIDSLSDSAEEHEGAAEILGDLRRWAAARRDGEMAELEPERRRAEAADALEAMRARAATWEIDGKPGKVMRGGLKKTYKRARKGHDAAKEGGGSAELHAWRKRVKYHHYHCRLIAPAWPEALKARAGMAKHLAATLGDDHDLTVLARVLEEEAEETGLDAAGLRLVQGLLRTRSGLLRQEALTVAPQLFVDSPKGLAKRLARYWALASPA